MNKFNYLADFFEEAKERNVETKAVSIKPENASKKRTYPIKLVSN